MTEKINFEPDFDAKENTSDIKVIGVGGAGSNAVQHMYSEGIVGVDFLICNTDERHLEKCAIREKLLIGNGLGAGGDAKVACAFAEKSEDKIREFIGDNTKMLFITAGMGKGTGTGASPVIAKVAKDMGILTIGVVTKPFAFEKARRKAAAEAGIEEMSKYVDSIIVIDNQNLMKYFLDCDIDQAYVQVDDILKNSVKSIAEIVTRTYKQNVDFEDVKATMKDSGKALLGTATASGEERVNQVLEEVLNCPLLENQDITNAKNFLFFVSYGPQKKLTLQELSILQDRFDEMQSDNVHLIWGHGEDETLGDSIKLSVVITNFTANVQPSNVEDILRGNDESNIFIDIDTNPKNQTQEVEKTINELESGQDTAVASESAAMTEAATSDSPWTDKKDSREPASSWGFDSGTEIQTPNTRDDDDWFEKMVSAPAIWRSDAQAEREEIFMNSQTSTVETEKQIFELHDDTHDVFYGIAD